MEEHEQRSEAGSEGLLQITCRNCGAAVGYDIEAQSYRCPACGQTSGIEEFTVDEMHWRPLDNPDFKPQASTRRAVRCPGCGSTLVFNKDEESITCKFCGSSLVSAEFEQSTDFPEMIIPFALTPEAAQQKFDAWLANNQKKVGNDIKTAKAKLEASYLPYKLVRGAVYGEVKRERTDRLYQCRGFVEGTFVNTSHDFDNLVLDEAEPFDIGMLRPFEHGYIAKQRVRLSNLAPETVEKRTLDEITEAFKPYAARIMHSHLITTTLQATRLLEIPLLLPFYTFKTRNSFVAINGQTGKIAFTQKKSKQHRYLWLLEPLLLVFLIFIVPGYIGGMDIESLLGIWLVLGFIGVAIYGRGRYSMINSIIGFHKLKKKRKHQLNGIMLSNEGKNPLTNSFSNLPVFTEKINGKDTSVTIRFYSFTRIFVIVLRLLGLVLSPLIVAGIVALLCGSPLSEINYHFFIYWCFLIAPFCVVYISRGVRRKVYEFPLMFYKNKNGRLTRTKRYHSNNFSILGTIGMLKKPNENENASNKISFKQKVAFIFIIIAVYAGLTIILIN